MFVYEPDPHPGRCENHRRDHGGSPYDFRWKRCLRREGHTDACRFEPDRPSIDPSTYAGSMSTYERPTPTPWVEHDPPNPGSSEALAAGCICAVLDNNHGRFAPWPPDGWWITEGCPVHQRSGVSCSEATR